MTSLTLYLDSCPSWQVSVGASEAINLGQTWKTWGCPRYDVRHVPWIPWLASSMLLVHRWIHRRTWWTPESGCLHPQWLGCWENHRTKLTKFWIGFSGVPGPASCPFFHNDPPICWRITPLFIPRKHLGFSCSARSGHSLLQISCTQSHRTTGTVHPPERADRISEKWLNGLLYVRVLFKSGNPGFITFYHVYIICACILSRQVPSNWRRRSQKFLGTRLSEIVSVPKLCTSPCWAHSHLSHLLRSAHLGVHSEHVKSSSQLIISSTAALGNMYMCIIYIYTPVLVWIYKHTNIRGYVIRAYVT